MDITEKVELVQWEAERQQAQLRRWLPIVRGAGIDTSLMSADTVYAVAGRVMHDREVARLRMLPAFQIVDPEYASAFDTDWPKLFSALDCAALRARLGRFL